MAGKSYEDKAIEYCEKYGIIQYKISNGTLVYYANYPAYLGSKKRTYKVTVDLDNMEEKRVELKRYNPEGNYNMYK